MYTLLFDKKVKKVLGKLQPSTRKRILHKIYLLQENPQLGKHLIGLDLWSLRIGKFRVIYKIVENKLLILILTVEHRKRVYEQI